MLQAIRDRAQGIFAWIMLIAIGVPFALWGIQNYMDSGKEKPAAVVGDREIFDREVTRAYEQSLASIVGVADYDEKQLRHEALERLVREEIVYQEAEAKSLAVSDSDVRGFIQSLPFFQTDGKFDKEKYKVMLAAQNIGTSQFAAQIRRALLMDQFQKGLMDSAFVTKDQLQSLLRLKNQVRDIEYVKVPLTPSTRAIPGAEIDSYYKAHLQDFRYPEQVSVEYLAVSLEDLAKAVQVGDEDLRRYYDEQKANFGTEERRKVSHILLPVTPQASEADDKVALSRITQLRERLVAGEDFAKVAAENSGDVVSAKQGGDLGFIDKGSIDKDFARAAYALKVGELSEPVRTSFGYHLIKVTELVSARIKTFEEVKEEIRKTLQHNMAENKFYELGQILTEQSYEHPDSLDSAAKLTNLEIRQTGLLTRDSGDGIAAEPAVRSAAFSEEVLNGRNSDPVEIGNEKAVVLRIKEHRLPSDKPLAEVKESIVAKLHDLDARNEASNRAKELLKQVQAGDSLADAAAAGGLTVVRPPALSRNEDKVPSLLVDAVFKMPRSMENKGQAGTVELEMGEQIVFSLLAVKDGAVSGDKLADQEAVQKFLLRAEGQRELGAFIARLRERADVQVKRPES